MQGYLFGERISTTLGCYFGSSIRCCNLCSEIAPDNFAVETEEGHDYVYKQPEAGEEMSLCLEALECCPVEAIGNNG